MAFGKNVERSLAHLAGRTSRHLKRLWSHVSQHPLWSGLLVILIYNALASVSDQLLGGSGGPCHHRKPYVSDARERRRDIDVNHLPPALVRSARLIRASEQELPAFFGVRLIAMEAEK
jgi:hypothetical protein